MSAASAAAAAASPARPAAASASAAAASVRPSAWLRRASRRRCTCGAPAPHRARAGAHQPGTPRARAQRGARRASPHGRL